MSGILHKFRGKGTKSKKSGTPNAPNPEDVHVGISYSEFDPSSYQRVVVEESTHISFTLREGGGTKEKVGKKGTLAPVLEWLSQVNFGEFQLMLQNVGFDVFAQIDIEKSDRQLVEAIVERWWDSTHTFHFPCGEIGFTPLDFSMLTGLRVGEGKIVAFDSKYELFDEAVKYLPFLTEDEIYSGSIKLSHLEMYTAYAVQDDINEREIGFRAFMLYVIGNVLLANSHSKVRLGYLASLIQIDEIGIYDWGGAAYTHLIMSLDLVCRFGIDNGSKAVVGMWQVIEYWYYSYFRNGMHVRILEEPDQFPAINNWGPTYRHKVAGEAHCNLSLARQQIESRTRSSIVWLPWVDSTCIRINHPYVRKALELTSRRCILFGPLVNVWYLGERCRRQVTGVPSVPCDPPSHMNLNGCQTDILLQWYNSGGISVDALIRQVSEQQYTDYWAHVSVGMLLPPTYRGVNVDFVGASGLKEDVGISQPMGATLNRSSYPPLSQVEAVVTPEANWVIPITCRNGEIFNLRVPPIDKDLVPHLPIDANLTPAQLKTMLEDYMHATASMASFICKMNSGLHSSKDDILEYARQELNSHDISYSEYPEVVAPQMTPPQVQTRPSISREDVYVPHFAGESTDPAVRYSSSQGEGSSSYGFY